MPLKISRRPDLCTPGVDRYANVTELNQVVSNNVALFIQYFRQTKTTLDWQVYLFR